MCPECGRSEPGSSCTIVLHSFSIRLVLQNRKSILDLFSISLTVVLLQYASVHIPVDEGRVLHD